MLTAEDQSSPKETKSLIRLAPDFLEVGTASIGTYPASVTAGQR
jgi:hypothetical protein